MKRIFLIIAVFVSVCVSTTAPAKTPEERRLEKETVVLDHNARQSQGERAIIKLLKNEFNVDEAMINDLRDQQLGYGEIAVILSLSQQMPGRTVDINVNKILSLRQSAPAGGWGMISDKLGLKLGAVVSQIAGMRREVNEDIKKAQRKEYETGREEPYERSAESWAKRYY